jgi:hypothetical protein
MIDARHSERFGRARRRRAATKPASTPCYAPDVATALWAVRVCVWQHRQRLTHTAVRILVWQQRASGTGHRPVATCALMHVVNLNQPDPGSTVCS